MSNPTMTSQRAIEVALAFYSKTMRVNSKGITPTLKSSLGASEILVEITFGCRHFEISILRHRNIIKLSEIYTRQKFAYDRGNPLNGFGLKKIREERPFKTDRLSNYYTADNDK